MSFESLLSVEEREKNPRGMRRRRGGLNEGNAITTQVNNQGTERWC